MMNNIVNGVVTAVIVAAILGAISRFQPEWVIKALGGATAEEVSAMSDEIRLLQEKTKLITTNADSTFVEMGPYFAAFQSDGNMAIYDQNRKPIWHTHTDIKQ